MGPVHLGPMIASTTSFSISAVLHLLTKVHPERNAVDVHEDAIVAILGRHAVANAPCNGVRILA